MRRTTTSTASLRQILQRSVLSAGVSVFLVSFVVALYLAYSYFKKEQSRHHHAIHDTLAELVTPALSISDTIETNRLLGLASKGGEFFGIVTADGSVLISDYTWLSSIMRSFPIKSKPVTCENLALNRVEIFGKDYEVFCSQVKGSPLYGSENKSMGVLLGYFSSDIGPFIPHLFSVLIGIVSVTLVFLLYLLRRVISKKILQPLENLVNVVKRKAKHPLDGTSALDDIGPAPKEVQTLKTAYEEMVANFQNEHRERNEADKRAALYDFARQIAHDIRGPLAALDMEIGSVTQLPEGSRVLIRSIVARIHDIANDLVSKKATPPSLEQPMSSEETSIQLLSGLMEGIVTEKRGQHRGRIGLEIRSVNDASSYGLFANIKIHEFKRALSNLIDNSVEAIGRTGQVTVGARLETDQVVVYVKDNGKGIPEEIIPKLAQRDKTFGKEKGTGLGLYQVRISVESWGGTISISSQVGAGTTIELFLPSASAPEWFVSTIDITSPATVVVLDDDPSIHQIWNRRLAATTDENSDIALLHFSSPEEILRWHREESNGGNVLYLIDYELTGYETTGLDIIENLGITDQAILVTSRHEESPIVERCGNLQTRMIPKGLAGFVPIDIKTSRNPSRSTSRSHLAPIAGVQG